MHPELAEEHRAGFAKLAHDRRVLVGDPVGEDLRSRRRADPFCREQVLHRDGNAVQRAAVAPGRDLVSCFASLRARKVGGHRHERVEPWLDCFDARKARFGQLRRRDAPLAHQSGSVFEREVDRLADGRHATRLAARLRDAGAAGSHRQDDAEDHRDDGSGDQGLERSAAGVR
jgi:hypothetical protein